MKIALSVIIGFALGFFAHSLIFHAPTAKDHWRAIDEFNARMRDPANWKPDPSTGFSSVETTVGIDQHLAALVDADELLHADLVLPTVPKSREANTCWMTFCDAHKEFVYATGNPESRDFPVAGAEPLHLNLWFKPADVAVAQTLVRNLEALSAEKKGAAAPTSPDVSTSDVSKLDAKQILDKVVEQYKTMQSYQSEGVVDNDVEFGGTKMHTSTAFSLKLKKPNQYLITWTQKNDLMPGMAMSGAVWNAGAQPYLYTIVATTRTYSKVRQDMMALAAATGISSGAAHTIPSHFFAQMEFGTGIWLTDPKVEKIEKIDGEECYVISGSAPLSKKQTYWVSTRRLLILQWSHSIDPHEGRDVEAGPEMTDQQLDQILNAGGRPRTPEERAELRETMKRSLQKAQETKMSGSATEHHTQIASPELKPADFEFKVPEGTSLNESLFGEEPVPGAK